MALWIFTWAYRTRHLRSMNYGSSVHSRRHHGLKYAPHWNMVLRAYNSSQALRIVCTSISISRRTLYPMRSCLSWFGSTAAHSRPVTATAPVCTRALISLPNTALYRLSQLSSWRSRLLRATGTARHRSVVQHRQLRTCRSSDGITVGSAKH